MSARVQPLPAPGLVGPTLRVATIAGDEVRRKRLSVVLEGAGLILIAQDARPEDFPARVEPAPDAVVLSWEEVNDQTSWVDWTHNNLPDTRIIIVAASITRRALRDLLRQGVDGVVLERDAETSLGLTVRVVCAGQLSLPQDMREQIQRPALSAREKQILAMVVMGFTNAEIAGKLFLAESTVKSHLSSAFARLGVRSRNEATSLILDPDAGLGTGILAISGAAEDGHRPSARVNEAD
jgi:DNA-binding NarL/FixJ family response regulator